MKLFDAVCTYDVSDALFGCVQIEKQYKKKPVDHKKKKINADFMLYIIIFTDNHHSMHQCGTFNISYIVGVAQL